MKAINPKLPTECIEITLSNVRHHRVLIKLIVSYKASVDN